MCLMCVYRFKLMQECCTTYLNGLGTYRPLDYSPPGLFAPGHIAPGLFAQVTSAFNLAELPQPEVTLPAAAEDDGVDEVMDQVFN